MRRALWEQLIDTLGEQATAALIREYGGTRLWVPTPGVREESGYPKAHREKLLQILGAEAFERFSGTFGGGVMIVPRASANIRIDAARIAELHRAGRKIDEIAAAVGCSRRTVFRYLGRPVTEVL